MDINVEELLGIHEVNYYIKGEIFYYLNDSSSSSFFYDRSCNIKSNKNLGKYLKLVNFFLSNFNLDSINPFDIVFKIRINKEKNVIQFEKAFSNKGMFFTDKMCNSYLKTMKDFQYGDFFFINSKQVVDFREEDFLENQLENFLNKDFLKFVLKEKICRKKSYLSRDDVSFFKVSLNNKDIFV